MDFIILLTVLLIHITINIINGINYILLISLSINIFWFYMTFIYNNMKQFDDYYSITYFHGLLLRTKNITRRRIHNRICYENNFGIFPIFKLPDMVNEFTNEILSSNRIYYYNRNTDIVFVENKLRRYDGNPLVEYYNPTLNKSVSIDVSKLYNPKPVVEDIIYKKISISIVICLIAIFSDFYVIISMLILIFINLYPIHINYGKYSMLNIRYNGFNISTHVVN